MISAEIYLMRIRRASCLFYPKPDLTRFPCEQQGNVEVS